MTTNDWQEELRTWETMHLCPLGRYNATYVLPGFAYLPGEWVPMSERYSAMLQHRWAFTAASLRQQRAA